MNSSIQSHCCYFRYYTIQYIGSISRIYRSITVLLFLLSSTSFVIPHRASPCFSLHYSPPSLHLSPLPIDVFQESHDIYSCYWVCCNMAPKGYMMTKVNKHRENQKQNSTTVTWMATNENNISHTFPEETKKHTIQDTFNSTVEMLNKSFHRIYCHNNNRECL